MSPALSSRGMKCPDCVGDSVYSAPAYGEFYYRCEDCGCIFMPDNYEEDQDDNHCPHCESVDAIVEYEEQSLCRICGLDPDYSDYDAPDIAHLWKGRCSDNHAASMIIREALVKSPQRFKKASAIGTFLREHCGPHCAYAKACPQSVGNLAHCFNEERNIIVGKLMPKKRKKRRHTARKPPETKQNPKGWVIASGSGWFSRDKRYGINTDYKESNGGEEHRS